MEMDKEELERRFHILSLKRMDDGDDQKRSEESLKSNPSLDPVAAEDYALRKLKLKKRWGSQSKSHKHNLLGFPKPEESLTSLRDLSKLEEDFSYNMGHPERGCFVIFINNTFDLYNERKPTTHRLPDVQNSTLDVKNLKRAVMTLGFEYVRIIENAKRSEIKSWLVALSAADHSNVDCFGCAISTRQGKDGVLFARDAEMELADFTSPFCTDECPTLAAKPKLFFLQLYQHHETKLHPPEMSSSLDKARSNLEDEFPNPKEADFFFATSALLDSQLLYSLFYLEILNVFYDLGECGDLAQAMSKFQKYRKESVYQPVSSTASSLKGKVFFPRKDTKLPSSIQKDSNVVKMESFKPAAKKTFRLPPKFSSRCTPPNSSSHDVGTLLVWDSTYQPHGLSLDHMQSTKSRLTAGMSSLLPKCNLMPTGGGDKTTIMDDEEDEDVKKSDNVPEPLRPQRSSYQALDADADFISTRRLVMSRARKRDLTKLLPAKATGVTESHVSSVSNYDDDSCIPSTVVDQEKRSPTSGVKESSLNSSSNDDNDSCKPSTVVDQDKRSPTSGLDELFLEEATKSLKHIFYERIGVISGFSFGKGKKAIAAALTSPIRFPHVPHFTAVPNELCRMKGLHANVKEESCKTLKDLLLAETLSITDFFDFASISVKAEAENLAVVISNKAECYKATQAYVQRYGNFVGLIGTAGVGKTTLTTLSLQNFLVSEFSPDTQFVFYISFLDFNWKEECSLINFLLRGSCNRMPSSKSNRSRIEKLQGNNNVIIIFDGLDQVSSDKLNTKVSLCSVYDSRPPIDFVRLILKGQLLPLAKKFVTSRPQQFFELNPDYKPHYVVYINGLNALSQKQLCQLVCGKNFLEVTSFLDAHPDLLTICYTPVNCIITLSVLIQALVEENRSLSSMTELYAFALCVIKRSSHLQEASAKKLTLNQIDLWKLSLLAWYGFKENKFFFTKESLKYLDIEENKLPTFVSSFLQKEALKFDSSEKSKVLYFSHLTLQEYFAATFLVFRLHPSKFHSYLDKLTEPSWEVVSKFVFGLFRPSVIKKTEFLFSLDQSQKKNLAIKKEMLFHKMKNFMKWTPCYKFKQSTQLFLQLCEWIHEAGCQELDSLVAPHLPKQITLCGVLHPVNIAGLKHVLRLGDKLFSLQVLPNTSFTLDSQERFFKSFSSFPVKIAKLDLKEVELYPSSIETLADAIRKIEVLKLNGCQISSNAIQIIALKIALLDKPMVKLSLRFNNIKDDGARAISKVLSKINCLDLCDCNISGKGATEVGLALKMLSHKMKCLNLSENDIGDDGISTIAEGLHNIEQLNLSYCEISSRGASFIGKKLLQPIEVLNLTGNWIGDEGAKSLATGARYVKHLILDECGISKDGGTAMKQALSGHKNRITGEAFSSDEESSDEDSNYE